MQTSFGIAVGLAAVLVAAPALAGKGENSIKFASDQVPESLDAYFNNLRVGVIIAHHVWDHLVYRDPTTNEHKPSLAAGWHWVDSKTLDFELRRGVHFHNGEAFDAADVVYTLNFVADPANKAIIQQNVNWIAKAERLDQYKVRLHLKAPFPAALEYLAGPVVIFPDEYYKAVGPQGMGDKPVGTGPYKVIEHQPGRLVRFERNRDYFKASPRPQPTIDRLELRLIPDFNTQVSELMSGDLDWIFHVPPDQAAQLSRMPNLRVVTGETMRVVFLQLNSLDQSPAAPLKDVRVRRAIAHAVDRSSMIGTVVGQGARIIHTLCFPRQFGCTDESAPRYSYNTAKAKALLAEAGYPNGFEVDLYAYRERHQTEAIIGYLRAVGIRANLRYLQFSALRDALREGKVPVAHRAWGSYLVNDVSAITSVYFKFLDDDIARDPQVRDWLQEGDTTIDPQKRKAAYQSALARIADQAYVVPLYALPVFYAYARDLHFVPYPDELPRFWEVRWK